MAKKALVIVESPSKAKTIQKYLGREYVVKASVGHIKDLPKSKLGVDIKKGFRPDYQLIPSKIKIIEELRKASSKVPELYLATDPDREGEAIAWHIHEELKARGKKTHRVLFNSITKPSIIAAMKNPQKLNEDKYHAQQARRVLDRLVGYKISPLLWDKVRRGLSAGRVQSVALRMVVDREAEIKAFKSEEYWQIEGLFLVGDTKAEIKARLAKINGADPELGNQQAVEVLLQSFDENRWRIESIEQKERTRKPSAPFITSRLQQEAARKLGFSAKKTMAIAQRLYEGLDLGDMGTHGLITYMRTDSVRIDGSAQEAAKEYIQNKYGKEYVPAEYNIYKSKKTAQEAHEAIRPTSLEFEPEKLEHRLEKDDFRLYQLIWNRFLASQMTPAVFDQTILNIEGATKEKKELLFRATGSVMKFAGFSAVYAMPGAEENDPSEEVDAENQILTLPPLKKGDPAESKEFFPTQHFTQPPPHYSDASLIRELEEKGIGRPSTYASILSNLQDREYVEKREGKYFPSELGTVVTELLVASFPTILNTEFTAEMENQLDDIEEGKSDWKKIIGKFWKPFEKVLESAKEHMKNVKQQEVPTNIMCERCDHRMVIKWGRAGSFLACSNYPECKNTQDFKKDEQGNIVVIPKEFIDKKCDKCGNQMVVKNGKFGKFLACSDYPNCKFTQAMPIGIDCPVCKEGELIQKQSRYKRLFYSCNRWPKCNFATWDKPVAKPCPQCGFAIVLEKISKRQGTIHYCGKKCGYSEIIEQKAETPTPEVKTGT